MTLNIISFLQTSHVNDPSPLKVPLVSHLIVLSMCVVYSAISAFVKVIDTVDSWQIASHREIQFNLSVQDDQSGW